MGLFPRALVEATVEEFALPEPIVEIGSYQVEGQESTADLRPLFRSRDFIGCDLRPGPGVDRIEDIERLSFPDLSVGTLLCLNVLEHVWNVMNASREIARVVKPAGVAIVSSPFHFHIHEYPSDYWRFTPEALSRLFEPFHRRICGQQGYKTTPRTVFCLCFKEPLPDDFDERRARFLATLESRGTRRFPFLRMLRYQLGSLLAGKRPFRDYFHCNDLVIKE